MEAVVTVTVNVLVTIEEQDGVFLADCPFLNIVSQGKSEEEAVAHFKEEMQFLFEACHSANALEAVLDHRTSLRRGARSPEDLVRIVSKRRVPADIPAELLTRFTDAAASFH